MDLLLLLVSIFSVVIGSIYYLSLPAIAWLDYEPDLWFIPYMNTTTKQPTPRKTVVYLLYHKLIKDRDNFTF